MAASLGHVLAQIQRWASPRLEEFSDAQLLKRFIQDREESAFAELVARHGAMVLHSCRRILGDGHDAEDAFQATFLILARKAQSLRQPDALPGYLHSIARRVALKARARAAIRTRQSPLPDHLSDPRVDPLARLTARELLTVLDEEVARLPRTQRSAVVLCCLEGRTQEEAARLLGWTAGSLRGHLERGRHRLQARLLHRGITLPAALAIVAVSRSEVASAPLFQNTVQAALHGGIDSTASALAHSVLKTMLLGKIAGVMTVTLTLALAASTTVVLLYRGAVAEAPEDKPPATPVAPKNLGANKPPVRTDVWGDPLPPHAAARLGSLRFYHGANNVQQVVLSPDGKLVASTANRVNKLWDVQTGRELPLPDHLRQNFVFTANGKLLVAEFQSNRLWDLATGKEESAEGIDVRAARKRKQSGPRDVLSPDRTIVAVWDDKGLRLLDASTRKELPPLQGQPAERGPGYLPCFSPDGKLLAVPYVNSPTPGVRLWDLTTRKEARWLRAKDFQIFDIDFSADGKIIAAADGNGVTLWDANTGEWLYDPGHTYCVGALAFTPDGKTLLTGAWYTDRFLRLWDPFTGKLRGKWKDHEWGTYAIAVTPDGKQAVTTSQDRTIRIWDLASGKESARIGDGKFPVWAAALSPDGKQLATTGGKGIQIWDFATRRKVRSFGGGVVSNLTFSPDGTKLASSASKEATVRLWNVANGKELRQFKSSASGGLKPCFSPDGILLATGESDGIIHIWDTITGKEVRRLGQPRKPAPGSSFDLGALTFSPDGRVVAAGYSDQTVRLLEVTTGKERACYQGHRAVIISLAFSSDGRLLASGSWDRTVMVWDVTGQVYPDNPGRFFLDARAQERLWTDLVDSDAAKAYQAVCVLLRSEQTVSLLRTRLGPAVAIDVARLNRLVAELDSDDFTVREKAMAELTALGDRAESVLRTALPKASAEARRRIEDILVQIDPASSADSLRGLRAVEVLERLGTTDARQLLKMLAEGDPNARLTREAKRSLERLAMQLGNDSSIRRTK